MAVIKTDRDIIVHEQSNGDLWVYERGGLPAFSKKKQALAKGIAAKSLLKRMHAVVEKITPVESEKVRSTSKTRTKKTVSKG